MKPLLQKKIVTNALKCSWLIWNKITIQQCSRIGRLPTLAEIGAAGIFLIFKLWSRKQADDSSDENIYHQGNWGLDVNGTLHKDCGGDWML